MIKRNMKIIKLFFLLISVLFCFTGCSDHELGLILLNSVPITQNNITHDQKIFRTNSKVYYIFIAPKKMTNDLIRVQVSKMTDKAPLGGYEVIRTNDYRLMRDERYYYTNSYTFYEKGRYLIQVFSHDDFARPLAYNDFYVK